jgi:hypothetical protein
VTAAAVASGVAGALDVMWERFAVGGALLLLSVLVLRWPRSIWVAEPHNEWSPPARRVGLLAVCAVAVFFRTYKLELPGIWGDDAINGLLAFQVLDGKITSPLQLVTHSMSEFHALTNYAIAGVFWAFGAGPATLRQPGIIVGILAVPLFYGVVAPLFGARVGLVAALFFACSPVQVSHSKILIQVIFGEFFLLLGLCPLVRGFTGRRRWLIVAAGAPIAASLYTYHSAKLVPAIAVVFLLAMLLREGRTGWRTFILPAVGFVVVVTLCALPAVYSYLEHPGALTARIGGVALWQPSQPAVGNAALRQLWDSVWRTLMIFHYQQGPVYHWMGIGSDPAFNAVVAFLLVHGLVQGLRHLNQPRHWALFGWVAIGLLPGFLSTEAPRVYRVLLATPPLYLWAALPVVQLYDAVLQAGSLRRWLQGAIATLVLAVPVIDFNYYFFRVYTHGEFRWFQAARMVDMAQTLRRHGAGWTGYVLSDSFDVNYETLRFLARAWGLTIRGVDSLAEILPVREPEGGALFMMDRDDIAAGAAMRALYPGVALDVHNDPPPRSWWFDRWLPLAPRTAAAPPTGAFFPVSRQAADSIRGVTVTFLAPDGGPISSRIDRQLLIQEQRDLPAETVPVTRVQWFGALEIPTEGSYAFALQSGAAAQVWIDGRQVVSHDAPEGAAVLAQGLHRITAEAAFAQLPVLRLQWRSPGGNLEDVPPEVLLRNADVHGLLAEYEFLGRKIHRIEPYPYYSFFPPPFSDPFTVRWRGALRVPLPGRYRLEVAANPPSTVNIDWHVWSPGQLLSAGMHSLELVMPNVRGGFHLELFWSYPDGTRELIPPDAFSPPLDAALQ